MLLVGGSVTLMAPRASDAVYRETVGRPLCRNSERLRSDLDPNETSRSVLNMDVSQKLTKLELVCE